MTRPKQTESEIQVGKRNPKLAKMMSMILETEGAPAGTQKMTGEMFADVPNTPEVQKKEKTPGKLEQAQARVDEADQDAHDAMTLSNRPSKK